MSKDRSLQGQTLRFTFSDGPTAGKTYEHVFNPDGTVTFRDVDSPPAKAKTKPGKPTTKYASFKVAPGIHVASYLSESGYTLTTVLDLNTGKIYGFASNEKEWHPATGKLEVVE